VSRIDPVFQRINYGDAGYIELCYTDPSYRGKGIFPYVLFEICNFLKQQGKLRALISSKITNLQSRRGIIKAGFSVIAEMSYLKLLFLKFYKVKNIDGRE